MPEHCDDCRNYAVEIERLADKLDDLDDRLVTLQNRIALSIDLLEQPPYTAIGETLEKRVRAIVVILRGPNRV